MLDSDQRSKPFLAEGITLPGHGDSLYSPAGLKRGFNAAGLLQPRLKAMSTTKQESADRRSYNRRTDQERIAELEARIAEIQAREDAKKRKDDPLLKDVPKLQRRLRKFAQLAAQHERLDIANSVTAWVSSLDRMVRDDMLRPARLDGEADDELDS